MVATGKGIENQTFSGKDIVLFSRARSRFLKPIGLTILLDSIHDFLRVFAVFLARPF